MQILPLTSVARTFGKGFLWGDFKICLLWSGGSVCRREHLHAQVPRTGQAGAWPRGLGSERWLCAVASFAVGFSHRYWTVTLAVTVTSQGERNLYWFTKSLQDVWRISTAGPCRPAAVLQSSDTLRAPAGRGRWSQCCRAGPCSCGVFTSPLPLQFRVSELTNTLLLAVQVQLFGFVTGSFDWNSYVSVSPRCFRFSGITSFPPFSAMPTATGLGDLLSFNNPITIRAMQFVCRQAFNVIYSD